MPLASVEPADNALLTSLGSTTGLSSSISRQTPLMGLTCCPDFTNTKAEIKPIPKR